MKNGEICVENKENLYDKTPFYMTYPLQNLYVAEMEYERDLERMKELYPRSVQQLLRLVERRCDELEQEGSRMYDENPDRFMMEKEACDLYERFIRENPELLMPPPPARPPMPVPRPIPQPAPMPMPPSGAMPGARPNRFPITPPEEFRDMMERPEPVPRPYPGQMEGREDIQMQERGRCENSWLCSLIGVLFNNEVYRRRCRNRRCRRWSM